MAGGVGDVTDLVELVAWLLKQFDEDERAWQMVAGRDVVELLHGEPLAPRMLADINAKRALLAELASANMVFAMRLLAEPYADKEGFREEWRAPGGAA
jgi:hypothetical protein